MAGVGKVKARVATWEARVANGPRRCATVERGWSARSACEQERDLPREGAVNLSALELAMAAA
jgi:hypothetical protein